MPAEKKGYVARLRRRATRSRSRKLLPPSTFSLSFFLSHLKTPPPSFSIKPLITTTVMLNPISNYFKEH